ncbi:caffeine-induced death protein 2-domain-containing protein [Melampsora americana]|nr:caffeine-induced death protein 2-domain-containing protein [Melampsora americana]
MPAESSMSSNPPESLLASQWLEPQFAASSSTTDSESRSKRQIPGSLAICGDLSEFRKYIGRYRKLDDSLTLHLNRISIPTQSNTTPDDQKHAGVECAQFWGILTQTWLDRENVIRSCINVLEESLKVKSNSTENSFLNSSGNGPEQTLEESQRRRAVESELYNERLRLKMIYDELNVESLIRQQSMKKFRSRCSSSIFSIPTGPPALE